MLEFVGNDSLWKVLSAIFYGISSFSIMIINKSVLTYYHFPSFQALSIGMELDHRKTDMKKSNKYSTWYILL